jgi:hypothetical protein
VKPVAHYRAYDLFHREKVAGGLYGFFFKSVPDFM